MTSRNSPDLARLAALDAGLLAAQEAAAAWAAAEADPQAAAVLAALAATRAELAAQPSPALPADVASRIAGALDQVDAAAEGAGAAPEEPRTGRPPAHRRDAPQPAEDGPAQTRRPHPVRRDGSAPLPGTGPAQGRLADPRDRRRTPRPVRRGMHPARRRVLAAAAVLAVAVAAGSGVTATRATDPRPASPVLALRARDLAAAAPATVGTADLGALADPVRRAGCLRAVGVAPAEPVLGGRRVVLDGQPGVLLVLPTGILGSFRLVVVGPGCGPDAGTLLADRVAPE